uniref:Uncharacterized protein n=1 Tax=Arundo donax TaxID=35708 RepID=A0A0A9GZZ1_ARUDO
MFYTHRIVLYYHMLDTIWQLSVLIPGINF